MLETLIVAVRIFALGRTGDIVLRRYCYLRVNLGAVANGSEINASFDIDIVIK